MMHEADRPLGARASCRPASAGWKPAVPEQPPLMTAHESSSLAAVVVWGPSMVRSMQVAQAERLILARGALGMFFRSARQGSLDRRGHAGRQHIGWNLVTLTHHAARRHQRTGSDPR